MLTGLEAPLQRRGLREGGELLLDEVFPLEEVGVGLEGGFPLVCGLFKERRKDRKERLNRTDGLRVWNERSGGHIKVRARAE